MFKTSTYLYAHKIFNDSGGEWGGGGHRLDEHNFGCCVIACNTYPSLNACIHGVKLVFNTAVVVYLYYLTVASFKGELV